MNFENIGFLFPYVRFFNALPQGGSADFYIGNNLVAAGIKFGAFTNYIKLCTTPTSFKVTRSGIKTEKFCDTTLAIKTGNVKTLCMLGKPNTPELTIIDEPTIKNNMSYGHLRICNLTTEDLIFDIYANGSMILGDVNYKDISKYIEIVPGEYELDIKSDKKKVFNCGRIKINPGKFNTIYIIGLETENPFINAVITTDAASYSGFYL